MLTACKRTSYVFLFSEWFLVFPGLVHIFLYPQHHICHKAGETLSSDVSIGWWWRFRQVSIGAILITADFWTSLWKIIMSDLYNHCSSFLNTLATFLIPFPGMVYNYQKLAGMSYQESSLYLNTAIIL